MPVTVFSIFLTGLVAYLLCRRDTMHHRFRNLFTLAIIIHISAIRGYYMMIGMKSEISYDLFISIVMLIVSFAYILFYRKKNNYKTVVYSVLFISIAILSIEFEYIFPYANLIMNNQTSGVGWDAYIIGQEVKSSATIGWGRLLVYFALALSYFFTLMVVKDVLNKDDLIAIIKNVKKIFPFLIGIVFIEYISKNFFGGALYDALMDLAFGTGSGTFTALIERGMGYQLQGISREPAHLAFMLLWGIVIYFLESKFFIWRKFTIREKIEIIFMIAIMILSGSFSTYIYLVIIAFFIVWLYQRHFRFTYLKHISILSVSIIILLSTYYVINNADASTYLGQRITLAFAAIDLIDSGMVVGTGASSALARFVSIHDTAWDFWQRP